MFPRVVARQLKALSKFPSRFITQANSSSDKLIIPENSDIITESSEGTESLQNEIILPTENEVTKFMNWDDLEYKYNQLDRPYRDEAIQQNFIQSFLPFNEEYSVLSGQLFAGKERRFDEEMDVAFYGSTNSGKSSLINAVLGKYVAKASQKLSKTQDLKRYKIGDEENSNFVLVDSPGYGFVRAPLRVKKKFRKMLFRYVANELRLLKIYLCINANNGLKSTDLDMLDQLDRFK